MRYPGALQHERPQAAAKRPRSPTPLLRSAGASRVQARPEWKEAMYMPQSWERRDVWCEPTGWDNGRVMRPGRQTCAAAVPYGSMHHASVAKLTTFRRRRRSEAERLLGAFARQASAQACACERLPSLGCMLAASSTSDAYATKEAGRKKKDSSQGYRLKCVARFGLAKLRFWGESVRLRRFSMGRSRIS